MAYFLNCRKYNLEWNSIYAVIPAECYVFNWNIGVKVYELNSWDEPVEVSDAFIPKQIKSSAFWFYKSMIRF